MAFFKYHARDHEAKELTKGTIEAENRKDAMAKLRAMGLTVLSIEQTFKNPDQKAAVKKSFLDIFREKTDSIVIAIMKKLKL
ncbi:MAG: hypothetical protein RDV48_19500 [Candidatus Eremiobacteraeota bacterium]|nr:hypothetical protein [Candidatus Eremiobacteraeota bacterium]